MIIKHPIQTHNRKGFIIVITLVLLLVMTTMGIGLFYSTKQTAKQVSISGSKTGTFYSAESCIAESINWLENKAINGAPCRNKSIGSICHSISNKKMTKWKLTGEKKSHINRMHAQGYKCSISLLGSVAFEGDEGVGFDIGESDSYSNVKTSTKYIYKINSTGYTDKSISEIEVITSMIF